MSFMWFQLMKLYALFRQPTKTVCRSLPEEGVMLDADLPQPLGSSVVWKLKTNCAFELLILKKRKQETGKVVI